MPYIEHLGIGKYLYKKLYFHYWNINLYRSNDSDPAPKMNECELRIRPKPKKESRVHPRNNIVPER